MEIAFLPIAPIPCATRFSVAATRLCYRTRRKSGESMPRSTRVNFRCCAEPPAWKRGPVDVDFAKDEQLQILEGSLSGALRREDYLLASEIRDKLLRLQSGAYVSVLSANMKFYKAFTSGCIVNIAGCWLQDESSTCKHPSGRLVTGYMDILNSFGFLFSNGLPSIDVSNVRISMRGTVAFVTCEEHSKKYNRDGKLVLSIVLNAINIFAKKNGEWYLCHHSVAPIIDSKS